MKYLPKVRNTLGSIPQKRRFGVNTDIPLPPNELILTRKCDDVTVWIIDNGRNCEVRIYNNINDYNDKMGRKVAFRFTIKENGIYINPRASGFDSFFRFDQPYVTEILEYTRKEFAGR